MRSATTVFILVILGYGQWIPAKVDLVTLPQRDAVQLTIYNSADLTLVRESRRLTLKRGENQLQFSWADTLIDPTSLAMTPRAQADRIDILDLVYPPRAKNLGIWNIQSGPSGAAPVEISYLTSGLSWRAFYLATLAPDETTMRLQGYVRITNHSGEDYENAQVRLIVGSVHLIDQIAELARRPYPYGHPGQTREKFTRYDVGGDALRLKEWFDVNAPALVEESLRQIKEIRKEGLSEYFLYTIEGTETIPTGTAKRLASFTAEDVPVMNLYKYEEERYGSNVVRFLSFANDQEHKLGETPIPGGTVKVYRAVDATGHLSYEGQAECKYIPVAEEVELNLGADENVVVTPKQMEFRTENILFDGRGNIAGWDEVRLWRITVKNTRDLPVEVEIRRDFGGAYWDLQLSDAAPAGEAEVDYTKHDATRGRFRLQLKPGAVRTFGYRLRTYHEQRRAAYRQTRLSADEVLHLADAHARRVKQTDQGFDLNNYPDRRPVYNESQGAWWVHYQRRPNRWPGDHFAIEIDDETQAIRYHGGA
ncbi:MAG: DUF4139 domain-containing protein [Sedimentisphaerales bacterium]|nr:DUF4139 domain-containing protein [Sedimentisphaerales bacterium]